MGSALDAWADAGFSGAVVLTGDGGPECAAGYGIADRETGEPLTADSVFAIGSVSKTFVAAAILALQDSADLSLSDPAGEHVPGLTGPAAEATVEELLLHTSGLVGSHGRDHRPLSRDEAVAAISSLEVAGAQAGKFLYSNAGYTLLALVIDELAKGGYRSFMTERILPQGGGFWDGDPAPAGPRAVGYLEGGEEGERGDFAGPHWALDGNGDLAMSLPALATWTRDLFTGQILPPAALEPMLQPGTTDEDGRAVTAGWVRLEPEVFGAQVYATAGGGGDTGHNVVLCWLPDSERVVAIASTTAEVTAEELLLEIGAALAGGGSIPVPDARATGSAAADPAVAGRYRLADGGAFVVDVAGGSLLIRPDGREAFAALLPASDVAEEDVARHEAAVRALLGGETKAGRAEVEALGEDLGPLREFAVLGSVVQQGELRTYVTLSFGDEKTVAWYVLNDAGGVEAVDTGGILPSLDLVPAGSGYRVADSDAVSVAFDGDRVTVTGPDGSVVGERD